jgi:hypothetical protein
MKEGDSVWLTGLNKAANLNGSGGKIIGRRGERFLVALDNFDGPVRQLLMQLIIVQVNIFTLFICSPRKLQ